MDWLTGIVHWLHVLFAIFWFGSTLFTDFVLMPAVIQLSPGAQRELGQRIGPIAERAETAAGIATIVLGVILGTVAGPVQSVAFLVGTAYGLTWLVSLVLALAVFAFGALALTPAVAGVARATTPAELATAVGRLRVYTIVQLGGFLLIFTGMVLMHFEQ
jgi:uncharacterized membrane protein